MILNELKVGIKYLFLTHLIHLEYKICYAFSNKYHDFKMNNEIFEWFVLALPKMHDCYRRSTLDYISLNKAFSYSNFKLLLTLSLRPLYVCGNVSVDMTTKLHTS